MEKMRFNKNEIKKLLQYSKLAEVHAEQYDSTDKYLRQKFEKMLSDEIKKEVQQ